MDKHDRPDGKDGDKVPRSGPSYMINRREFLKDSAAATIGMSGVGALVYRLAMPSRSWGAVATPRSAKDTIVVGWEAEMSTLEPTKLAAAHDFRYAMQVGETMARLEGGASQVKPSLATQWKPSPDGKQWTFTIRPGVRFHDGTPLRAQDVEWSYRRWMDPKHPFYDPPYGVIKFFLSALENVDALDDKTVRITLKYLDAAFDLSMLWPYGSVISPEALRKVGNDAFARKPIATGPWKVAEWTKGTRLILERNGDHWGHAPILNRMIIKPVPEDAVRLAQLKSGDVDVIVAPPPQFISAVESDPNLRLLRTAGAHVWWIALNLREKPLADKRVRQALNYAVNKDAVVRDLLRGGARVTKGPMVAGSWAEDASLAPYPYDPKKAKDLLTAAGYGRGFRTRFWVPGSGSGMIAPKEIATLVQAQLKDVGVIADIVTQEWTSYVAQYGNEGFHRQGKPAFGLGEMSWNPALPDPAHYLDINLKTGAQPPKGFNAGFYSNPEVDRLLTQASNTLDRDLRKRLYARAQRLIYDDAPWIFMFSAENLVATRKNIKGLEVNVCPWWLDFTRTYVEG